MKPTLALLPAAALFVLAASAQVKITPGSQKIAVEINGLPFTEFFMAGDQVVKPYLFPLRAPSGTYVTRMWPMEKVAEEDKMFADKTIKPDHPHQRGVWFAHDSVNKLDFWNIAPLDTPPYNRPDRGKIVLKKVGKVTSGRKQGSIAATFEWQDRGGSALLTESRVMTFYRRPVTARGGLRHHPHGRPEGGLRRQQGRRLRHSPSSGLAGGRRQRPHGQCRWPEGREGALGQAVQLVRLLRLHRR